MRLQDVARLETGHTPSREHPEYWDGDVNWIGIKDAREHHGRLIHETYQTVTPLGLDNSAARLLPADTVCLSRTASVGYVVVMGKPMATSQDFVNWVCSEAVYPKFLMYLFIAEHESLFRFGKGTTHTTIYFPEVKAFHICLPPLAEQHRIVAKIEALRARSRAAREALEAVPTLLEQFRKSVLAAAFRGDLTADWREDQTDVESASALLERIRQCRRSRWEKANPKKKYVEPEAVDDSGLPELPEGWVWASLEQVSGIGGGLTRNNSVRASSSEWVPLVTVAAVRLRSIDPAGIKNFGLMPDDGDTGKLEPDDLLVVEGNGSLEHIGRVALWDRALPNARHQNHLIRVRPIFIDPRFVLEWLASPIGRTLVVQEATTTAGLYNLSLSKVGRVRIPIPPLAEQSKIVKMIAAKLASVMCIEAEVAVALDEYRTLDQSILAKAFRGELAPQDANDEPASVLLDRIRQQRTESARPDVRGTPKQIDRGQVSLYIMLLLRAWKKPVARAVLEPALVLMLNDTARQKLLGKRQRASNKKERGQQSQHVPWLDALLGDMQRSKFIAVETRQGQQVLSLGPQAPDTSDAPGADVRKVTETIQAISIVGEDRALIALEPIAHESYELIS